MNEKALKYAVFTILFLLLAPDLSAEISFSVTPVYRTSWGTVHEYVFVDNDNDLKSTPEYMLSRLDWDIAAVPSYGGELQLRSVNTTGHIFSLNGTLITAHPAVSGRLQDYDWSHKENGIRCGALTNYSNHTNTMTSLSEGSISGQWTSPSGFGINIGWEMRTIAFSASDGYSQYGTKISENNFDHVDLQTCPKEYSVGLAASYGYLCNYLKIGLTYTLKNKNTPMISAGIWGIPLYAATGKDIHIKRIENFWDDMYGYFCGITESLSFTVPVFSVFSFYLKEEGTYIQTIKGNTYSWDGKHIPNTSYIKGYCGSGMEQLTITAGLTLSF